MRIGRVGMACWAALLAVTVAAGAQEKGAAKAGEPLCVSGVYPHLTVYNFKASGEVGIGAVVPWAGRLWMVTYTQHAPNGSADKLYAVDEKLNVDIRPESVGGTPAGRLIHKESKQLFIGHHAIDEQGRVRTIDIKKMPIRVAAIARHLTDPAGKVMYQDMEGPIYEVDVKTLEPKLLWAKPVPGWHGKGCYTGQGRFIVANNGEAKPGGHSYNTLLVGGAPKNDDERGVLAEWDGKTWKIIERKQFTDVTGPGGIYGSPDEKAPVWAIGWDRRSTILKLCDNGQWSTFRLPKANHTYDPKHGYYTEWPRIREVTGGKYLMDMCGMFFDFPKTFSAANTAGIAPVSSHLRYIPDFCAWNGRLVLATDETTRMENPMVGQCQSNLWFGQWDDLKTWGPRQGWGGVWINDAVKAGVPSDPFLLAGFERRVAHLANEGDAPVTFQPEIDRAGNGQWEKLDPIEVPAHGYVFAMLPDSLDAQWGRVTLDRDCPSATAFLYYSEAGRDRSEDQAMFASLAGAGEKAQVSGGLLRPASENRNLIFLEQAPGKGGKETFREVDEKLQFSAPEKSRADMVKKLCAITKDFETDEASVILKTKSGQRYRLPKGDAAYDKPFAGGWPRGFREVESERTMANIHGTFYLLPRETGVKEIQPVATHNRQIMDYCTWRGMLVLAGARKGAKADGHFFGNGETGLWFGQIDEMWKLGKPVGKGGVWKNTAVKAGKASDPYLMTGYDKKSVALSHDVAQAVTFTLEVDVDHSGVWRKYQRIEVPAGQTVTHEFPEGYNAHWVRVKTDRDCTATAMFSYE